MVLLLFHTYLLKIPFLPKAFLALTVFLLSTYLYAPQFSLMLIPLLAVLGVENLTLYFWDIFNAGIILTWFLTANASQAGTLPQLLALLRDVALAGLAVSVLASNKVKPFSTLVEYLNRIQLRRPQSSQEIISQG